LQLIPEILVQITTSKPHKSNWLTSPVSGAIINFNVKFGYWVSKAIGFGLGIRRGILLSTADIDPRYSYVLAANHQCRADPFVISGALPYLVWRKIGVFRYMVYNPLFDIPVLGQSLLALGCFPAMPHPVHPHGLGYSRSQLAAGRNILIFPEGRRVIRGEREARWGVAKLAKEPNVLILPAHIEWRKRGWWHGFDITVGKPFDGSKMTPKEILDHIYELPMPSK
jgi:1-acyl-sn-glycerol-3-phosphate acyltransferase